MNQLDILPQNMPRRAEAQPARGSGAPDGKESGPGASAGGEFDALLSGLRDEASSDTDAAPDVPSASTEFSSGADQTVANLLNAVLTDGSASSAQPSQAAIQVGSSVLSVLEGLLPRVPAQDTSDGSSNAGQPQSAPQRSGLNWPGQNADGGGRSTALPGAKLQVAVQHQETHFRPVVEEFSLGVPSPSADSSSQPPQGQVVAAQMDLPTNKLRNNEPEEALLQGRADLAPDLQPAATGNPNGEQNDAANPSPKRDTARVEISKQAAEAGPKTDTSSLPPATLHRIAGAVLSETRAMAAELNSRSPDFDGMARLMSARAPDGVLRVLQLQLHPAELGLVTIKMRLAGDNLEMELQTSSEETAQLLRHDSEKLSGLLRGSGYRPDVISIQVKPPDAPQQDASFSSRPQPQSQQQTFHQGASQQEGRFRHRDEGYESEGAGARNDADEDGASRARNASGIYL